MNPGFTVQETNLGYFESASLLTCAMGSMRRNQIASESSKKSPAFFVVPFHPRELQRKARHVKHVCVGGKSNGTPPEAKPDLDRADSDASTRGA
jgi:hypothetical protein